MTTHIVILISRAVTLAALGFLAHRLLTSVLRNGFAHHPMRWLLAWLAALFAGLTFESILKLFARIDYLQTGESPMSLDNLLIFAAVWVAVASVGTLQCWLRFPEEGSS